MFSINLSGISGYIYIYIYHIIEDIILGLHRQDEERKVVELEEEEEEDIYLGMGGLFGDSDDDLYS